MPSGPGLVLQGSRCIARATPFSVIVIDEKRSLMLGCDSASESRGSSSVNTDAKCSLKHSALSSSGIALPWSLSRVDSERSAAGFTTRQNFWGSVFKRLGKVQLKYLSFASFIEASACFERFL